MKIIKNALIVLIGLVMLTGCSSKNSFDKQYEAVKQDITLKNGMTQYDVEENIKQFIRYAYAPNSLEEQQEAMTMIQPLCTESEWNQLKSLFFYKDEEEEISDMKVYYGNGSNMTDGVNREVAVFNVNYDNGDRISYIMIFNLNDLDMITSHYIIRGFAG